MSKFNTFFYILKHTFTSVDYYQDILKAPFKYSLKFYYAYFFIFSIVITIWLTFRYYLPLNQFLTTFFPAEIVRVYPEDLEITIKDGAVSTNSVEPYYIPMSSIEPIIQELENRVLGASTEDLKNILVIDTMADIKDFPQYHTLALLTKHHLSVINEDGNIETIPLDQADNLVVNQSKIKEWVQVLNPYLGYIVFMLIGMTFIGVMIFLPLWKLVSGLFLALILQVICKLMNRPITFQKSWQLELHFMVISTTFLFGWKIIGVQLKVPFLEIILVTILGGLIIKHLPKNSFEINPKSPQSE